MLQKSFFLVFLNFFFILSFLDTHAQSIQPGINFQAVARDKMGNPANNRKIYVKSNIVKGAPNGLIVFGENHVSNSNESGIFNIVIGKGARYTGVNDIYSIDWTSTKFYFQLSIAITPVAPSLDWEFNKEWIDLGTVEFGVVPYAIQALSVNNINLDTSIVNKKLNIADTADMLFPYKNSLKMGDSTKYITPYQLSTKTLDTTSLSARIISKLNKADTTNMLLPYLKQADLNNLMIVKLNNTDTAFMLSPYVKETLLTTFLAAKLNTIDTSRMLIPYLKQAQLAGYLNTKLNSFDTTAMLTPYLRQAHLTALLTPKLNSTDSSSMLLPYLRQAQLTALLTPKLNSNDTLAMLLPYLRVSEYISDKNLKLNISDTALMLSNRITRDTQFLSNRVNLKEDAINKSLDISLIGDYNHNKYPSVKAIKDYVDAALIAGAPDATTTNKGILQLAGDLTGSATNPTITNNAITTLKLQDASVTDAKIASGISASKVGLGNVTNQAQLYNLNGLTSQVQNFNTPGVNGIAPNWQSTGAAHTLHIPMASAGSVTAGLISKLDFDAFTAAYNNSITNLTNSGNNGIATISNHVLNVPTYTLTGMAGNINANLVFAGPTNGAAGTAGFRALVAADIPNNAANTLGNAATANKLRAAVTLNNILFDGASDNTSLTANTPNNLSFTASGTGAANGSNFNGSVAREISYNTIGAAPLMGANSITTLGTITSGAWEANVIGSNYGGAGNNNGILMANGAGVVSVAVAGTHFQNPLTFSSPLINTSNTISIPQANSLNSGYLSNNDWYTFNNKIDLSQKAAINGVASLDVNGKIPTSQIPSISFSSGYVVVSQAAMLALSNAVVGSIAIRTDNSKNYVLSGLPSSTIGNWLELLMPVSVSSVNGHTESNINLTTSDITEGTNLYFTNTLARNAISASSPVVYTPSTGVISMTAATSSLPGYLTASDWSLFNSKLNAFTAQAANVFFAGPVSGTNAIPTFRNIVASDVPILNQATTANAGTATKLATSKNINGVPFDGSANITITANLPSSISFDDSGLGAIANTSFNGAVSKIISYNTIGAAPSLGSNAITTLGSITTGTWLGTVIDASHGGSGNVNGILKANGAGTVTAATAGTDFENPLTFSAPLARAANAITLAAATTTANGYLTATDWNLFNGKQSTIAAGTGVSITGGNTVAIGQSVASSASPSFTGITLSGLNVAGIVTNSAAGVLGTAATTGTGNIVRATSPTLVTPILGDATATSISTGTITATSINASSDVTAKRFKLTMPSNITATATTNIDLSTGNVFTVNMGLNITSLTFSNAGVGTYLIKFVQDGTGTRDVSFPAAWKWAGSVIPSLTNTPNKLDIVTLIYDGTTYYTTIVQNF